MKSTIKILAILFLVFTKVSAQDIETLIKNKKIETSIYSTGNHYGNCLLFDIKNNTNKAISVEVPAGTYLQHSTESAQDHYVTENLIVKLAPNANVKEYAFGVCCEYSDAAPGKETKFSINTSKAQANIVALCKVLASYNNQGWTEQQALWLLVKKQDPEENIEGEDSAKVMTLRKYVCKELGFKPKPLLKNSYVRSVPVVTRTMEIECNGGWLLKNLKTGDLVESGFYDENGNSVGNKKVGPANDLYAMIGDEKPHRLRITMSHKAEELNPDKKYYLRIKVNGVVYKEWMYTAMS
jgi:hypothetical protein